MKKLLMLLLVLVFSFALCLSVSAHDTEPADTPPTETKVTESADASGGCNHVNLDDSGPTYLVCEHYYGGPTMCKFAMYVDIICKDCGEVVWSQFIKYVFLDHAWTGCPDGYPKCDYCPNCGYHSFHGLSS